VPGLQKRVPCFVRYGCVPGLYPDENFVVTAFTHSATPTNFIAGPLATILRHTAKMKNTTILIIAVLFLSLNLKGQNRTIIGRVISEHLEPLFMVNIQNSDTLLLGKTDMDGRFTISIPHETGRLLFGDIGMERTEIILKKDCDTVEVVMMYGVIYDFITLKKVDKLRKKRFDNLPNLHSEAVKEGLFQNNSICYERVFEEHNPPKPVLDSIKKKYKLKRKQNKDTFKGLALGDTIRIPYYGTSRYDGTNTTNLNPYSFAFDKGNFDCIIQGVITEKNKRKGGYNLVYRVIDCIDCHYDNMVINEPYYPDKELKVGETFIFNLKYSMILKNK